MTNSRSFTVEINKSQTLLGIDLGDKTIGIALSDISKIIANPLTTIERKGYKKDIKKILALIIEHNASGIVLGLPLSLNGKENARTEKVRKFAQELEKNNIKTTFYDERYSSDVIFKELRKNSLSKTKIKKKIDQMAASYILQGFLDNLRLSK